MLPKRPTITLLQFANIIQSHSSTSGCLPFLHVDHKARLLHEPSSLALQPLTLRILPYRSHIKFPDQLRNDLAYFQ